MLGVMVALAYPATSQESGEITVTADVPTYVSVVFNYNSVSFGSLPPGTIDYENPGNSQGIYNVTVSSNVNLTVSVSRTPWSPHDVLILKFAHGLTPAVLTPDNAVVLTTSGITYDFPLIGQLIGEFHGYWLTVPAETPPGSYSTTVTITYTPAP